MDTIISHRVTVWRWPRAGLLLLAICAGVATSSADESESATQTLTLAPGWNFIAFYVEPDSPKLRDVFAPLFESGISWEVWAYDNSASPPQWDGYRVDEYGLTWRMTASTYNHSTFSGAPPESYPPIRAGYGYWIFVDDGDTAAAYSLEATGSPISGGVSLLPGWNLVGAFSPMIAELDSMLTEELAQANLKILAWSRDSSEGGPIVERYPPGVTVGGAFYEPEMISPGCAYWVYVDLAQEWGGPVLSTDAPQSLSLGAGAQGQTISIKNVGMTGTTLTWSVEPNLADADPPWVSINPSSGSVETGEKTSFRVSVDWAEVPAAVYGWKGGTLRTSIVLASNGGIIEIPVVLAIQEAGGHYEGGITPQTVDGKAATLPNLRIGLDLDPDDFRAVLTAEQTPFFPKGVVFDCRVDGADITLWTSFFTDANDNGAAHMFGGELVRTIRMTGTWTSDTVIQGTAIGDYVETLEYPGGNPVTIRGTFQLTRIGMLDPVLDPDTGRPVHMTQRDDRDADGLPDDWEISYGLFTDANDAFRDDDRDGRNNIEEYWDRTNPKKKEEPDLPSTNAAIAGLVITDANVPMEDVEVLAYFGGDVYRTFTSEQGVFQFSGLSPGHYIIVFGCYTDYRFEPPRMSIALPPGDWEVGSTLAVPAPDACPPPVLVLPSQNEYHLLESGSVDLHTDGTYILRSESVHPTILRW